MPRQRKRGHNPLALERMFDGIVNDVLEATPPSVLYHYTTWAGAEGILSSQQFWATAHDCTNDEAELVSADSIIVDTAKELRRAAPWGAATVLDIFIREYEKQQVSRVMPVYLVCFSALKDDAEQWIRYGDNGRGICLGVSLVREPPPQTPGLGSGLVKVDYSEASWRDKFRVHIAQVCRLLTRGANSALGLSALYRIAAFTSIMAKKPNWEVEQEYRLVTIIHPDSNVEPKERISGAKTIRYLPVSVRANGKKIAFAEIIVGPNQEFERAHSRLQELLSAADYGSGETKYPHIVKSTNAQKLLNGPKS